MSKGTAILKKITSEAKKEYKKKDNHKKWTTCIKEAAHKLRKKK